MPSRVPPRRPLATALALLVACVAAPAQPPAPVAGKTPLAVEDLYRLDAPRDSALAPDGKTVAYARAWLDRAANAERFSLWRAGAGQAARPAEPGEPDARGPVFSPDGRWVAFVSTRPRPGGWKLTPAVPPYSDPAADAWLIPAAGGAAVPLAGPDKPYGRVFHDGFYGRLAFSPDGTKLAFVADDGADPRTPAETANGVVVAREDQGEGYTGYGPAAVWVAHLDPAPKAFAATRVERLTPADAWYGDPNWSPDGAALAVHANRTAARESVRFSINQNYDVWLVDAATKQLRQLTTGPGPEVSPRFSPDGKRVACLSVPRRGPHMSVFNLMVVELGAGGPAARAVFDHHGPGADRPPHPAPTFPLPADCWDGPARVVYTAGERLANLPAAVDLGTGAGQTFTPADPAPNDLPASPAARLARRARLAPPGDLFLKDRLVGPQRGVRWKSTDGLEVEGVLTLPPEGVGKPPHKLIVYPHGGPHGRNVLGFDFTVQAFAAHGYAVFQPNFRGSTGYGQTFLDADRGDFGGGDMRDVLSGVDHLIAEGVADKDRLFVYGTSYGGYMTSWLVGQTDRFRAAAPVNGVHDLTMMWAL
ncbi:MAG TPA: prolyl oligopeptidase family serine peptidase, partial [Urbifossiella sp.]|nr:prolyl oligopeptidase family serine peptidase [Urbifossiella sp.]